MMLSNTESIDCAIFVEFKHGGYKSPYKIADVSESGQESNEDIETEILIQPHAEAKRSHRGREQ